MYDITSTSVGGNGLQQLPPVWMWVNQAATSGTAGYLLKRWFPVWMAQNQITLQNNVYNTYTAALGVYNPLRTAYNTAIKPVAKTTAAAAAATTATTAAKKVVIPLRPAPPTQPAAYAGVFQAPFPATASTYTNAGSQQATTTVAANAFVADGAQGGYGGWTMGFLAHTSATVAAVERSFGVFGWGQTTTTPAYVAQDQSFTSNWKQMCFNSTTNGSCPTGFVTYNTALKAIVALSVWGNSGAAVVFNDGTNPSSFKVTFAVSNWAKNAAAWAAPTRPAAATAPDTPAAGAKALAASAAAAVAVAAALY